MDYHLEKLFYAGPVTSLCFHNDIILLSGQGPYLKVFYVPTGNLLYSHPIIEYWRIHRIVPVKFSKKEEIIVNGNKNNNSGGDEAYHNIIIKEQRLLAIYGSKSIQFVNLIINYYKDRSEMPKVSISLESRLSPLRDWIHDVKWLYDNINNSMSIPTRSMNFVESSTIFENNPTELAIAFAHNFVEIWNIQNNTCVYSIQCEERCILYSARFFGDIRSELILASGTVFNQVHFWDIVKKNASGDGLVFKKLIGHEGVVFGIRFSEDGKILSTVSDDRTIRIWKTDRNDKSSPLVLYGHMARVWDCHILDNYLVSISEDSTCRVWQNSIGLNEGDEISDVDCLACWEGHVGKNVWSLAIDTSNKIVATGGGDSGIRLWSLLSVTNNKIDSDKDLIKIELPSVDSYARLEGNDFPVREHVRNFVLVDYCTIVIATNYGHLLRYNHGTKEWVSLYNSKELQNYTMMKASKCGRVVCCGSINGRVFIISAYQQFQTVERKLHQHKVFELFLEEARDPNILYVVSHAVHDEIYLLKLDLNCNIDEEPNFETLFKISVPPRFLLMSLAFCSLYDLLICGSRESGLAIYNLNSENSIKELSPIIYLKKTHGKQAVTSVALRIDKLENFNEEMEDVLMIYTSGRDGGYVKYRLRGLSILNLENRYSGAGKLPNVTEIDRTKSSNNNGIGSSKNCDEELYDDTDEECISSDNSAKKSQKKELVSGDGLILEQVYKVKITKGWLEKVVFVDDELMLLGFYRKRFFVYNEDKKYEMFSVACGGAHRVWHFKAKDKRMDIASFMFVRKENVYIYSREVSANNEGFNECKLQGNFHGRECRIVKYLSYPLNLDLGNDQEYENPIIFATGAEDSLLRLFQYIPGGIENNLVSLCSIKKHTSVIKSIDWSYGNELLLFSSGASEELRCWKVEVSLARNQPEISSSTYPLVNINCLEWSSCLAISEIPETRIMDISVYPINPSKGLHFVAAVYSDSVLRVWLLDEKKRKFFLIGDAKFYFKCILQVRHSIISAEEDSAKAGIILFTSATDGRIAIWDISSPIYSYLDLYDKCNEADLKPLDLGEPIYSYQAHQSGVNCLSIHQLSDCNSRYMIVTGGDDNAISIAYVNVSWDKSCKENDDKKIQLTTKPNDRKIVKMGLAHGSSIQGIHILNDTKILSTSLDQRLNVWEIDYHNQDDIDYKIDNYNGLRLIKSEFVDVCDPSSMDVLSITDNDLHVAIVGIGIEIFKA